MTWYVLPPVTNGWGPRLRPASTANVGNSGRIPPGNSTFLVPELRARAGADPREGLEALAYPIPARGTILNGHTGNVLTVLVRRERLPHRHVSAVRCPLVRADVESGAAAPRMRDQ